MQKIIDLVSRDRTQLPLIIQEILRNLEIKNSHSRDSSITFVEDDHSYFVNGVKTKTSCTTIIKKYFSPFDKFKIASGISSRNYKKTSQYYNKSTEDIINMWEREADLGTIMHANIEFLMNLSSFSNKDVEKEYQISQDEISTEMTYFSNFCDDFINNGKFIEPYRTEWLIYDESMGVAGSVDMVFTETSPIPLELFENTPMWVTNRQKKREDGKKYSWVFDWKRSKALRYEGYSNALCSIPGSFIEDCNFSTYSLQLNLYRTILEKNYDINVIGMALVVIHPNSDNYKVHLVPFLDKEMEHIYAEHKE